MEKLFPIEKIILTGNPIRRQVIEIEAIKRRRLKNISI
jgi:hypothetical protein